ncbi:LEA type 2 family protein [Treponema sp. OttesenSCG-928-L16]|nr:LEA type 2 family protein [Treponema sp. OttesenSCG-928-L16]
MKIVAFCAIPFMLLFFSGCQTVETVLKEPRLSVHSVTMESVSFDGMGLLCKVQVENPNAFAIPFPEIGWDFFINDNAFLEGVLKEGGSIKARETTTVNIPLQFTYEGLFNTFSSLIGAGELAYAIGLDIVFPIPIIEAKTFHLDFEGAVPIPRLPSFSFAGIEAKNISLQSIDFSLNWKLENKNSFALKLDEFIYDFAVNGSAWAKGSVREGISAGAGETINIPLNISINSAQIAGEMFRLISGGGSVNYSCTGGLVLSSDLPGFQKTEMPLSLSGTTGIKK